MCVSDFWTRPCEDWSELFLQQNYFLLTNLSLNFLFSSTTSFHLFSNFFFFKVTFNNCLWQLATSEGCMAVGVFLVLGVMVNIDSCSRRQIANRGRGVLKPCFWIWPLCLLDNHLTLPQTHRALSFQITAELLAQLPRDFHFHPLPSSHFFPLLY